MNEIAKSIRAGQPILLASSFPEFWYNHVQARRSYADAITSRIKVQAAYFAQQTSQKGADSE